MVDIFNRPRRRSFMVRNGFKEESFDLQITSMDDALRNGLWNVIYQMFFHQTKVDYFLSSSTVYEFFELIWVDYFENAIDTIQESYDKFYSLIRETFFQMTYLQVYDFLEYITSVLTGVSRKKFTENSNKIFDRNLSGWKFVGAQITRITSEEEISEINEVISQSESVGLAGVKSHINKAIKHLSNRSHPDYANSIKESISAVESICMLITGDDNASLGQALKIIDDKIKIHPALKSGFDKLYGYTSNEGGIRHAILEEDELDFEDAKYMLVSCSSFINYLIEKSNKSKINLN